MYICVTFLRFLALFRVQGYFQLFSSPIRSGVMADHRIQDLDCSRSGPFKLRAEIKIRYKAESQPCTSVSSLLGGRVKLHQLNIWS